MSWVPLNLSVRVGCNLVYETTVPMPVLFVLRPRLEGKVLVMQEKLSSASACRRMSSMIPAATSLIAQCSLYQVNSNQVSVGDPIDLTKRLDGTALLRFN
jgi:hypothetical protein